MRTGAWCLLVAWCAGCVTTRPRHDLQRRANQLRVLLRDGAVVSGALLAVSDDAVQLSVAGVAQCIYADEVQSVSLHAPQAPVERSVTVPSPGMFGAATVSETLEPQPDVVMSVDPSKLRGLRPLAARQEDAPCARSGPGEAPAPVRRSSSTPSPPP